MLPHVVDAKYVKDFVVEIVFNDGTKGQVDFEPELYGEVFEPLLDPEYFRQFTIHPELRTLTWPNGADFAPEFLYDMVAAPAGITEE